MEEEQKQEVKEEVKEELKVEEKPAEKKEEKPAEKKDAKEAPKAEEKKPEAKPKEEPKKEEQVEEKEEVKVEKPKLEETKSEPNASVDIEGKNDWADDGAEAKEEPKVESELAKDVPEPASKQKTEPKPEKKDKPVKKEPKKEKKIEAPLPKLEKTQAPLPKLERVTPESMDDEPEIKEEKKIVGDRPETKIFALRTTANREDQVMDFVGSNAARKKLGVVAVIRPHGMRGYIFLEALTRADAEQSAFGVPYARGILPNEIDYTEIEHMLEQVKKEVNIRKNDIAEIISGPFKREKCKITRVDKVKEEVVVELLEAAVPIPISLKMDAVKVIRRESGEE
jgi:transcriptional antiterminator NusG